MKDYKDEIIAGVERHAGELKSLSEEIWGYAELPLEETRSADALKRYLEEHGFSIRSGLAEMGTAFEAVWGTGAPHLGFLGEYDALPEMSQKAQAERAPVSEGAPGHACGHNLLGVGLAGSAVVLKELMERDGLSGTLHFYGCPAEEIMVGKIRMDDAGVFSGLDACLAWHPMASNTVCDYAYSAMTSLQFNFTGKSAHAAAAPEQGRSALDAVELMNVGANYLREHVVSQARIHYVITNGGGRPNVVPATAQSWYYVRAPFRSQVDEIVDRLLDVGRGAALMTGTQFNYEILSGCQNTKLNKTLNELAYDSMERIPRPAWSGDELDLAKRIQESFSQEVRRNALTEFSVPELDGQVMHTGVTPLKPYPAYLAGSTDVSNVSQRVPTVQVFTACMPVGTPGHTWQITACSGGSIGQKGMYYAAQVIADVALRLVQDKQLLRRAQAEFAQNQS